MPSRYAPPPPFGERPNPAFIRLRYGFCKELGARMGSIEAMAFVVCTTLLLSMLAYGRA
ncbi:MAG TPA: hypothetical protein VF601_21125 [Beijerinckiaceae bacterium]